MLDYASIIQGGMGLVPNLRDQMVQDAVLKQRETLFSQAQEDRAAQQQAAQQAQAKEAEFQAALEDAMATGDPGKIQSLRMRFPEFTKGMKDAFDAMDEDQRRRDLTQVGTIFARGNAGDFKGAADVMRARIEADRVAGDIDPMDEQILAGLESADPVQQRSALATAGIMLAAVQGDKFGEVYGKLNPTEATPATMREYDARVAKFGKAAADNWLRTQDTKLVPVAQGGTVFQVGGAAAIQKGGDPVSGMGGAPQANGAPSLTVEQFRANAQVLGAERASRLTTQNGIPVVVRSVQEANSLPAGTLYVTPTGERYTR